MFDCKIEIMEAFYEIYSVTMISGVMAAKEFNIVQQVGCEFAIAPEHRDMIERIFYAIKMGRIQVLNAEKISLHCVAA
ncbi:MAG: hypothetical protein J7647_31640 [Cyanobacteria bacterium SBLK]|nr:hypothetical protein [Cyanobacteria bacterium SBLK]